MATVKTAGRESKVRSCSRGLRASFFDRFPGRAVNNASSSSGALARARLAMRAAAAAAAEVRAFAARRRLFIAVGQLHIPATSTGGFHEQPRPRGRGVTLLSVRRCLSLC